MIYGMKLIVGLGNLGTKYLRNRHSVGHMFIDEAKKLGNLPAFLLYKTDCYMNQSGGFVQKVVGANAIGADSLYIVHDDLDIPLGKFKISFGTGPKVHNGVNSVADALGTQDFWRIRIGIDARAPDTRVDGETYVLQDFTFEELIIIKSIIPSIVERLS